MDKLGSPKQKWEGLNFWVGKPPRGLSNQEVGGGKKKMHTVFFELESRKGQPRLPIPNQHRLLGQLEPSGGGARI